MNWTKGKIQNNAADVVVCAGDDCATKEVLPHGGYFNSAEARAMRKGWREIMRPEPLWFCPKCLKKLGYAEVESRVSHNKFAEVYPEVENPVTVALTQGKRYGVREMTDTEVEIVDNHGAVERFPLSWFFRVENE